jgi:hypothetical protein
MSQYLVRHGFSIQDPSNDKNFHHGGSVIELTDAQAAAHMHKLEPYKPDSEDGKPAGEPEVKPDGGAEVKPVKTSKAGEGKDPATTGEGGENGNV